MFEAFFESINKLTGVRPKFYHIHKTGWACVLADMDIAQARGLGKALKKIDPSRKGKEHLRNGFQILPSTLQEEH